MTATLREGTQPRRMLDYIRANPGCSASDFASVLRIYKYTSRISDLRKAGYNVECFQDKDGVDRYRVIEPQPITSGEQEPLWRVAS